MNAWVKRTKKMDKLQPLLYFQQLKEKLAYRYFFSMKSDEKSHSTRKRMWKITSIVLIVFFLRTVLKRPFLGQDFPVITSLPSVNTCKWYAIPMGRLQACKDKAKKHVINNL